MPERDVNEMTAYELEGEWLGQDVEDGLAVRNEAYWARNAILREELDVLGVGAERDDERYLTGLRQAAARWRAEVPR